MVIMHNFNWSVSGILKIKESSSKIWDVISVKSNLELFHPFCDKNPVSKWPGQNSSDSIYYYNGLILQRKLVNWEKNIGYDLFIGKKNGPKSFVSWKIKDYGRSASLTVSIYPYMYNTGSKFINFIPFYFFIRPMIQKYINSVMDGLGYYIETGKVVSKNQFGTHSFFSN
tara:strand:- start:867 stop:1376 length:510 start_codon:yes stop_codon:yes gene_type:complete